MNKMIQETSKLTKLKNLYIGNINTVNYSYINSFVNNLNFYTHLTELNLEFCRIEDNGLILLCNHIKRKELKYLTYLSLEANNIRENGMISLAESLEYMKLLISLNIGCIYHFN